MTASTVCPDQRDLRRLALGQLLEAEAQRLGQHVLDCSACAERLNSLQASGDPLLADLTAVAGQELLEKLDHPSAQALVERLVGALRANADAATPSGSSTEIAGSLGGEEPLPDRLGRYQIVGRFGAGGMGVVCRAHDPQLRRDVAIKVPSFGGPADARAAARQRFLREARAAAAVRHSHICPIYDVGEDGGRPYVVMALVEGESLAERLRRQGRFEDPGEAVTLVAQVADALAAVHAASIIHRDLKPGNILLDYAGQPLLADFGLARVENTEQLTCAGALIGTPAYLSPEQAAPELGPVGPWSDQYSLGVVLYQLLAGRRPFEASSLSGLIYQLGTKTPPPPSQHRPDLDAGLERLLMKALARRPRDRYPSVADFAQALRGWQGGAAAAPTRGGGEGQHRRVTLLSCGCDVFDSEAILERLDAEEQHDLLVDFQELCREVAAPLAGTVVKATDRGLLICFGIPFALECAARRAVTVGLNLLGRMGSLNARLAEKDKDLRLSARIAIHSGLAIVRENVGPREPLSLVGQVLPVVDQLEQLAAPDTVILSDDTHRLLRGFVECVSLGTQKLKGVSGETQILRVNQERVAGLCADVVTRSGLVPLVGRDREVALLEERWQQAVEGAGQVVLLVGEAGIGKSRQVNVLKEYVAGQRTGGSAPAIIEWPSSPATQNSSFYPAIECFNGLLELGPNEDASSKLDKLAAHLGKLKLGSSEAVALLASLLSIPLDGRCPALSMSPQRQKEETLDLLVDWLREQAGRQPVLFIIEDLHWADPTTLEFAELLVGQAQSAGLLTVLTFRPEFVLPWKNRGHETQVSLSRLSRRQTGELMLWKSGLPTIPQRVLDEVVQRTDGVPLFVEELTAMLLAEGALRMVDGEVRLAEAYDAGAIPATLQDLLMARLDRVASNLEIAQLAATIGREFSYELLRAVGTWDEQVLQEELAKLVDAELLFVRGRPPNAQYQFKHALIRDAAYQTLLKKKRQQFHLRIAEVLEQRFPEVCANQPELLAHHFTEGKVMLKAVAYWQQAGERAQQRGAAAEAADHFCRGLEWLPMLPESRERHLQEIELRVGLGLSLQATRGYSAPEVESHYVQAQLLSEQANWTTRLFPLLYGRFRHALLQPRYATARQLSEQLLSLADREPTPGHVAAAHYALGATLFYAGKHADALPHLQSVLAVVATSEERSALYRYDLIDPWVIAQSHLSRVLWLTGQSERADEQCRQALATADAVAHPFNLTLALCCASWLHQFRRNGESTRAVASRALTLATEHRFTVLAGWARILLGWSLVEQNPDQAVAQMDKGLADLHAQGGDMGRSYFLCLRAEACARIGRLEASLGAIAQAQEFTDSTGEGFWLPEIHRVKGELLLRSNPMATHDAAAGFQHALDVARHQQARSLELRAAMSLARLWHQQGKTQAARELVEEVYAGFTEGFQTHDLQMARDLLAECRSEQR